MMQIGKSSSRWKIQQLFYIDTAVVGDVVLMAADVVGQTFNIIAVLDTCHLFI